MIWNKFAFALFMAVVYGLQKLLADNDMSTLDWISLVGILAAAAAAGLVPNTPWLRTAKLWAAGLVAGTDTLIVQLVDGWQTNIDLWPTLIAVALVVGVWAVPNPNYAPLQSSTARAT